MSDTSQNTKPIYSAIPAIFIGGTITAANTTTDLTSGTITQVWPPAAYSGKATRLEKLKVRAKGTNVATVLRVWLNNGGSTGTAANNTLYTEQTIALTSASQVAALADNEVILNLPLPAGWTVYVTIGTAVAAGLAVTGVGGAYQE